MEGPGRIREASEPPDLNYDHFSELPIAKEIVRHCIEKVGIRPGHIVLDIGTGTGDSVAAILEKLRTGSGWDGRVVSIEPDPYSLAIARERLKGCPVEFYQCTAQDLGGLPFATEKAFDITVWSNGIHYLTSAEDLERALAAIRRVTREKFAAWSTFVKEAYLGNKTARFSGLWVGEACRQLQVDAKTEREKSNNLQERGAGEYIAALLAAGFSKVESSLEAFALPPEVYGAIARFRDYVENALPHMPRRPEITLEMRSNALFDAVRKIYALLKVETLDQNWLYLAAALT